MSNVSAGALELCLLSGSTPSILPTMLGGSAPSQASGAPFRTESGSRATVWPPPAHQSNIFNRGYGIYSLFPGPGDPAKTLYTPTAKTSHPGNPFQDFVGTQKVPDAFFATKFAFGANGTPQFNSNSHSGIEREIHSRLELTPKNFTQGSKPYPPEEKLEEEVNVKREPKAKRAGDEVVYIKSEAEEINREEEEEEEKEGEEAEGAKRDSEAEGGRKHNEGRNGMSLNGNESTIVRSEDVLANEPDSTEFRISNEGQRTEDVTTSEVESSEKDSINSGNDVEENCRIKCGDRSKNPENNEIIENGVSKEKCNIKVIDLHVDGSARSDSKKKTEKCPVKVESINDICNRLTEKKYVKASESGCRNLTVNCKKSNVEASKPSPTWTLSLPPHSGGCSRTTPVTFKHLPQQESDPKPQNLNIEVPPLHIKKEPPDFQKYPNGTPFLSPPHLDFFSPGGLSVLDGQMLSPMPYSDSFESSARRKETFLSPGMDQNFLSPGQSFLGPRPGSGNPFLSPTLDVGGFAPYKNYRALPKLNESYMGVQKMPEGAFFGSPGGCLPLEEERRAQEGNLFANAAAAADAESKSGMPGKSLCAASNVTPCQVAEVTSASSLLSPTHPNPLLVKQEAISTAASAGSSGGATSTDQKKESAFLPSGQSTTVSSTVGVPPTRQRCQQRLTEMKIPPSGVPSPPVIHRTVQSPASLDISSAMGAAVYAGGMMEDRSPNIVTTWPSQSHNPTLWQYSAPIDYPPFPPVGFQLVRDPITGHFLLIPASNIEALQRAILWPSYQPSPPQMIIPPISVQPSTPHLLLDTNVPAVDFLTPETIHHGAPEHRILIATDNASKRKIAPAVIKVEASECSSGVVVAACDNVFAKTQPAALSPRRETAFHSQRSAAIEPGRRSQATSPCLTPALENQTSRSQVVDEADDSRQPPATTATVTLQDASNQTDMPAELGKVERLASFVSKDKFLPYTKITEQNIKLRKTLDVGTETSSEKEAEDDKGKVLREIRKRKEAEESLNIHISNVPDLNIKKEIISPSQVDLSGLELLSNSIEQFECDTKCMKVQVESEESVRNCVIDGCDADRKDLSNDACEGAVLLQNLKNGFREVEESEGYQTEGAKNFGGLGLLCALAEQRFQEEIGDEAKDRESEESNDEEEEEEVGEEEEDEEEDEAEEDERTMEQEEEHGEIVEREDDELFHIKKETVDCDLNSNYQSDSGSIPKLKKEVETSEEFSDDAAECPKTDKKSRPKERIAKKNQDSDEALASESVVRRGPGRPKKSRSSATTETSRSASLRRAVRKSKEMSPPVLERETDYSYVEDEDVSSDSMTLKSKADILKPPTLTPSTTLDAAVGRVPGGNLDVTPCEVNSIEFKVGSDRLKERSEATDSEDSDTRKRKLCEEDSQASSSKKRKVGRPKKHHLVHESPTTETIVAKKPKTKASYLFSTVDNSKGKLSDGVPEKRSSSDEKRRNSSEETDVSDEAEEEEGKKSRKIRPKLKAEPKVREWTPARDEESLERKKILKKEDGCKEKLKVQKKVVLEGGSKSCENGGINGTTESRLPRCVLSTEHLKSEKFPIRTLTAMGGLFYAGQLSAIRAPDVYGITIDGERGNRPHIYSREEILKDSILEVKPERTSDLIPGTRCCAYWSEQYRCLYPGTVSAPSSPDPELDDKFVNVEFDDGDSGRINIDDIRLLPEDHPVVEYDPNPLQSLSKRKRRISGASVESHSKERKSVDSLPSPDKNENGSDRISSREESTNGETEPKKINQAYEGGSFLSLESERRHLKKKRREKLKRLQSLSIDGKKKHKKHRCSDEHRHHRHHKKHRKHKHKHGKRHGGEVNGEEKKEDEKETSVPEKGERAAKKKDKIKCKSVENSCKMSEKSKAIKPKKCKKRTESVESRSKMAAFLPARQLWGWSGKGYRRPGAKGRARKEFYKTIQRGKERITVGDCAVFLSTGRPDRPYIGRIESMWESWGTNMIVRVKWFYHPEETVGCPATLEYPGALFESPHVDENDVQTISHKCEVLPLKDYTAKIGDEPHRYETIYDNNDIYYLAGYYDPTNTTLKMEPGVK